MQRLPGLDLLRAVAIIWVMLFHSYIVGGLGEQYAWLSRYGWMGVDLFFALSGYLIGSQVLLPLARGERVDFAGFYRRRVLRVLPAFAVVLAAYVAFPALREAPGLEPAWKFLTFTLNLLIDYGHNTAFSHAWSLCVEEHFYLVFPLLAALLAGRMSARGFVVLCAGIVLGGIALRAGTWITQLAPVQDVDNVARGFGQRFVEDIYYPTWNRLDGLLLGVVLAATRAYRPGLWARCQARANAFALAGVALLAAAMWLFRERTGFVGNTWGWPVLSAGAACLVLAGSARRGVLGARALPGAAWLAAVSYSLYLSHKLAFHAVDVLTGDRIAGHPYLMFGIYSAGTLAVGAVLHYTVERPVLRWRDRTRTDNTTEPAAVGA